MLGLRHRKWGGGRDKVSGKRSGQFGVKGAYLGKGTYWQFSMS